MGSTTSSPTRVVALVLLVLLGTTGPASALDDSRTRLDPGLRAKLETLGGSEEIAVNVVLRDAGLPDRRQRASRRQAIRNRQQGVLDALPRRGFHLGRRHANVNGFSLRASLEVIDALARHPETELVYEDRRVHAVVAQGSVLVGADHAHAVGVTGAGVNVAVLDSGIDTDHPELANDLVEERCWCRSGVGRLGCCPNGFDTQSGPGSAEDDSGHGTNVSGVITSALGVAPNSGIVALRVLDSSGEGSFSDIDAALDWLLDNHVSLAVRVVNLSLGDAGEYSNPLLNPCTGSNTAALISTLQGEGVMVFAASGNDAHDDGISFPACVPDAISVGGVYEAALGTVSWCGSTCSTTVCVDTGTAADTFVCHTNSDEILDLLAPDWRTTTTNVGGGSTSVGGTSLASPYAAAIAALLIEQDPGRTPDQVRSLMSSHGPMVTNPDSGLSFRRTDISALFALCGNGIPEAGEDCDDGNSLDGDCCSAICTFEASSSVCDDANVCTVAEVCDGAGACVGLPLDCDDGLFCNGAEDCDPEIGCLMGTPPPVDDGVACTIDACDEAIGIVVHTPDHGVCGDGEWCNGAELCDVLNDCQPGTPPVLDDGVVCTLDTCDASAEVSVHTPDDLACDDGDPCTAESCDALLGCVTDPESLCPEPVPTTGPAALWITVLAMAYFGVAWLLVVRRNQAEFVRARPR